MRLALVSDVHFGPPTRHEGKLRKLGALAPGLLGDVVRRLNDVEQPDLIVNLGDVVEDVDRDTDLRHYREFLDVLGEADAPVLHVAGNHELVHLSDDELAALWGHEGALHYSRDVGAFHLVVLRTQHRAGRDVRLPRGQLEWLREDLSRSEAPALVFVHHPLAEMRLEGNRWFERQPHLARVVERTEVREILERSGRVVGVFNGHVHWNHLDVVRGVPYVTLQSLTENLDDDAPGRPSRAHAIVDVDEHGMLVRVEGEERAQYQFGRPGIRRKMGGA